VVSVNHASIARWRVRSFISSHGGIVGSSASCARRSYRCSHCQDERTKEVGHGDRCWSELGGDIHGDPTIERAFPAGHRHGIRLRELVGQPCCQVVGHHQIELTRGRSASIEDGFDQIGTGAGGSSIGVVE